MIILAVIAGFSLFSFLVMTLWNAILPSITSVSKITFWQAMGLLVLSKLLFGRIGPGGGWRRHRGNWHTMREKWASMTPEEKAKLREQWRNKRFCRTPDSDQDPAQPIE